MTRADLEASLAAAGRKVCRHRHARRKPRGSPVHAHRILTNRNVWHRRFLNDYAFENYTKIARSF
jgi:hypothetical protein